MIRSVKEGVTLYSWPSLDRHAVKAYTAAGIEMALHAPGNDSSEQILKNRIKLSRALAVDPEEWICANQCHSANVSLVTMSDKGRGALSMKNAFPDTDALILSTPGLQGMIFTADCLPLILYDTKQKTGALVHAGWRGTATGIVCRTLDMMIHKNGSKPEDILTVAGPAIDACCYQVDLPVYKAMTSAYPETELAFSADGKDHWRLSLEKAVFLQVQSRGISEENCEGSGLCSSCKTELSSWRREGVSAGRMATCLCL